MNIDQLKELQQKAEKEFNTLHQEGEKLRERIQEIESRKLELRGEHSAYQKQIDAADPAKTIEAKPKESKDGK